VVLGAALAIAARSLAHVRDRAVAVWVDDVVAARTVLSEWAPRPRPVAPLLDRPRVSPPVRARRRPRDARDAAPLAPDERMDAIRAAFCPEAARLLCDARRRCGCGYVEPDCAERVEAACTEQLFARFESDAARLELDVAVRDRCLDGFASLPMHCELEAAIVHGCGMPVRDVAALDGECVNGAQRCRGGVCDTTTGLCVPTPGSGDEVSASVCGLDDVRVGSTCMPAVELGGECSDYRQCGDSRYECVANRCFARLPHGVPCAATWQCETGLVCARTGDPYDVDRCRTAPFWCRGDSDCGSEQACLPRPAGCRPCDGGESCDGTVRCDDGHRCGPGTECGESTDDEGQCQPRLCDVRTLEQLFEMP
jgi:hypothetical protein